MRRRIEQQAWALQRIAGDSDDARLLALHLAVLVGIDDPGRLARSVVLDFDDLAVGSDFELAGRLSLGDFGIERRPFGARFAALEAEADLLAGPAPVARLRIDRHAASVNFLVADFLGARFEHFEIVVARQAGDIVGAGHPHLVFGLGVVRLHLGQRDRPIQQIGAGDFAVMRSRLEFVFLEPQRGAGPMHRRTADGFDDPGGKIGEILVDAPRTGRRAHVLPSELDERVPFVVDEILDFVTRACFQDHGFDAFQRQFRAERAAAGARTDDDDYRIVVEIKVCHDRISRRGQSHWMSLKPRLT